MEKGLVHVGLNEPMVVTLSTAKSLGTMGGMLRSAQHDKPSGYFRRAVLVQRAAHGEAASIEDVGVDLALSAVEGSCVHAKVVRRGASIPRRGI